MNSPDIRAASSISASEFKQQKQSPDSQLRVIDVRTHAEIESESLAGCAHFPLQDLNSAALQSYLQQHSHDSSQPVYLLCASGQRAARAAEQVQGDLDNQLVIVEGGLNALKQLGIEVTKGSGTMISLERQVRIAAGSLVVLGIVLGTAINPGFYGLSAFVGAGLVFAGVTDSCGMGMILARMPWNN
ncbi:MAG: rhodanese-like domain-containing protein [Porticoccaceae bacterium]|jgi:rhodanese-related sulfurtransferase|nr:rhodanese-like domain-containing protein [Porticoccaceae bacterium]MBT6593549.1 rhodanese-like domain-containing protein [Porticoccaceae bacterium]MDB4581391.1 rhodanese-like domain-containing protein [Porticoccaceae bacterium]MDC3261074.1 rhodanese-like domain-containing protein [bacterium]